ncbi:SET domain-containing protein [Aureobasidium subglaciale]|nr:SET domain-containing protein [Aureobasidium subglaciale]KAI5223870.1 SET domain-containing protein [Aureobasidium subglaciale]KAI5227480.1 SET domain-containing protein [Aureobasidium subglaciale]KAI5262681.1 SET domain-containing protein [Aureobasidium subglaciale]
MNGDTSALDKLSAHIARAIVQQIATVSASGHTPPAVCKLDLKGYIDGDVSSSIDFGSFDISPLIESARSSVAAETHLESSVERIQESQARAGHEAVPSGEYVPRRSSRSRRAMNNDSDSETSKRRKITGGLRLQRPTGSAHQSMSPEVGDSEQAPVRRLQTDVREKPQRRTARDEPALRPSTLNKLIVGIWEQVFSSMSFDISVVSSEWRTTGFQTHRSLITDMAQEDQPTAVQVPPATAPDRTFSRMNLLCRKISQASRCSRALEVVVQASWIEHFDRQVQEIAKDNPQLSATKARMKALAQACSEIGWSEKEIRNKMAIWRGYKEIKDHGGWVCLVFAGMGIYRFCKYRIGFDPESMAILRRTRTRFEVAADTLHPHWRDMLTIVGDTSPRVYTGHPHDWVVSDHDDPVSLKQTYLQYDPNFSFTHMDSSIVDSYAFGADDPRQITVHSHQAAHICTVCGEKQSEDVTESTCCCFPNLFGSDQLPIAPVQIFRTKNGRNNGLLACCPFERGVAIGEFTGLITKGLEGMDVMQAEAEQRYQIYQGREGNYTRFVNHSCRPNSQFQRFVWLGTQRIILVSRGIEAGQEITVDYSDAYWRNLPKTCLCQESCCRFKDRERVQPRIETASPST